MIEILNTFILVVLGCAALLGVSALVEKRTGRHPSHDRHHTHTAA
jgi:hypothetical protein